MKWASIFLVAIDFLEKNRDTFSQDLMKLLQETKSKFLRNLFLNEFQIGTETRKRAPSLGTQFKKSLDSLMSILSACQPFFIRCIKPNEYKTPDVSLRARFRATLTDASHRISIGHWFADNCAIQEWWKPSASEEKVIRSGTSSEISSIATDFWQRQSDPRTAKAIVEWQRRKYVKRF